MRDATTDNSGQITSRTEYDGYGVEALLSGTASVRGDNKWAGKAGYLTEPENGLKGRSDAAPMKSDRLPSRFSPCYNTV